MKKIIYLDTCIFISSFLKEKKNEKVKKFIIDSQDIFDFVTSDWTLTEIVKVLIKDKGISSKKVANYIEELTRTRRIEGIKINWVPVSEEGDYDFEEFFYQVQKIQLQYKGSLGDAIHSLVMKNNKINTILTTDSEFEGRKGIIVINPLTQ